MPTQTRQRRKAGPNPVNEHDFHALDAWAKGLTLKSGRAPTSAERTEEKAARRVGRPRKPAGQKAARYMIAMEPKLHAAAMAMAKKAGISMSRLIADTLSARIGLKM